MFLPALFPPSYQEIRKGFPPSLTHHLPLKLPSPPDVTQKDLTCVTAPMPVQDPFFSLRVDYSSQRDFDTELVRLRSLAVATLPVIGDADDSWDDLRSNASRFLLRPTPPGTNAVLFVFQPAGGSKENWTQDLAISVADPDTRTIWYTMQNR